MKLFLICLAALFAGSVVMSTGLGHPAPWSALALGFCLAGYAVERWLDAREARLTAAHADVVAKLSADLEAIREKLTLVDNRTQPRIAR